MDMRRARERMERLILFAILTFLYTVPPIIYINKPKFRYSSSVFYFLIGTGMLSFLYASLCLAYRGFVRFSNQDLISLSAPSLRTCSFCMQLKPERAHHCSRCRHCIKKMDHHCHWLGRCINYDNLGHFIRFLFFTASNTFVLTTYTTLYFYFAIFKSQIKIHAITIIIAIISLIFSLAILAVTGIHLVGQIRMVINNITGIEILKKRNSRFYSIDPFESPYDMGIINNLSDVFGPPYFLFLGMPTGSGIHFKRKWFYGESAMSAPMYDEPGQNGV